MNELPSTWALEPLESVAEVRLGRQRSPKNHSGPQMRPYLRAANVDWDGIKLDDIKHMQFSHHEMATYRLEPGDLVLNEASGSPDEVGKPGLWRGEVADCAFQNTLLRVRPGPRIDPRYLLHFFRHEALTGRFARRSRGVGIHHLGRKALASWLIPVPPLEEQQRIVTILEDHLSRLDAAEEGLASVRTSAGALPAVVGHLLLRDGASTVDRAGLLEQRLALCPSDMKRGRPHPVRPAGAHFGWPTSWALMSLEEVTDPVRTVSYGILKPGPDQTDGVPYVRVVDMRGDTLEPGTLRRTSPAIAAQYARAALRGGDVLLSIRGTYGRVVIVPKELEGGNITQDTARLAFIEAVTPEFAAFYLRSSFAQSYMKRIARGVAVKGVNLGDLRMMPFPVPSLDEQVEIVRQGQAILSDVQAVQHSVGLASRRGARLRLSLLEAAFSGRLSSAELEYSTVKEPALV